MDKNGPAPFSEDLIELLQPLMDEAIRSLQADVSYGVAIIVAGRKIVTRRTRAEASKAAKAEAARVLASA